MRWKSFGLTMCCSVCRPGTPSAINKAEVSKRARPVRHGGPGEPQTCLHQAVRSSQPETVPHRALAGSQGRVWAAQGLADSEPHAQVLSTDADAREDWRHAQWQVSHPYFSVRLECDAFTGLGEFELWKVLVLNFHDNNEVDFPSLWHFLVYLHVKQF